MGQSKKDLAQAKHSGLFQTIKAYLHRDKLGELLVLKGYISPKDLKLALTAQKTLGMQLGEVLIAQNSVTKFQMQNALAHQFMLRHTAALFLFLATLFTFGLKKAKADYIKDVPGKIAISATQDFQDVAYYPALFGSHEKQSHDLSAFTKWTGMFERFDDALSSSSAQVVIQNWKDELVGYKRMPLKRMASKVNDFINAKRYIVDSKNWGKSDYWATPVEFMQRGGDCEDFAIAKYAALRTLGVPENRLRIAIVHDNIKNIPHAVLVVYTNQGPYILDNQIKTLVDGAHLDRYRPIFSINRQAWWLHTNPSGTLLASAQ